MEKGVVVINKLEIPCSYQGGKQRLAKEIVDIIFEQNEINEQTKFYDLCCGSGAVTIELISRGIKPYNITMVDASPWGLFWNKIGTMEFSISKFVDIIEQIPKDVAKIQAHIKELSKQPAHINTEYIFLLLQASAFGSKSIWIEDDKWKNTSFRSYWLPTETSSRRSPVNPMMPMPQTLLSRVREISFQMAGINGIYGDINNVHLDFEWDSIIYIDPPYLNTTGYGFDFDYLNYISKINKQVYISEGYKFTEVAQQLAGKRNKGGISGERKSKNEEWLNVHIG
jgi:site-specific DNA-adenine methylase